MSDPVYRSTWCNVLSALHMPVIWRMKQRTCPCPQYSVNSVFFPRLQIRVQLFKFYSSLILSLRGGKPKLCPWVHGLWAPAHWHERKEQPCTHCSLVTIGKEKKSTQLHCWPKEIRFSPKWSVYHFLPKVK